jgi:hypothetical protein
LLEDWTVCVDTIRQAADRTECPQEILKCMYDQLIGFASRHEAIFRDAAAASGFAGSFSQYHDLLRSQLAAPLRKFCDSDFTAEFVAESLLCWTMAGKKFEEIYGVIGK